VGSCADFVVRIGEHFIPEHGAINVRRKRSYIWIRDNAWQQLTSRDNARRWDRLNLVAKEDDMMSTKHKTVFHHDGFTLIELLIVIIVIAILALIVIPRLMNAGDRARASVYHSNMAEIQSALEQFHADTGVYPSTLADLYQTSSAGLSSTTTGYTNWSASNFNPPYLKAITGITTTILLPVNPYIANTGSSTIASNWTYTPVVTSNSATDYTLVGAVTPPAGY
jgi:type II secretion system protein G